MIQTKHHFIRELGYSDEMASDGLYQALMFQPRAVGALLLTGILMQNPWVFAALSAMLAVSALAPAYNPFDVLWNVAIARPLRLTHLDPAPPPKRTAAALAAVVSLAIAVALISDAGPLVWGLQAFFGVASLAVVLGRSCAGAAIYHRLARRVAPATK